VLQELHEVAVAYVSALANACTDCADCEDREARLLNALEHLATHAGPPCDRRRGRRDSKGGAVTTGMARTA